MSPTRSTRTLTFSRFVAVGERRDQHALLRDHLEHLRRGPAIAGVGQDAEEVLEEGGLDHLALAFLDVAAEHVVAAARDRLHQQPPFVCHQPRVEPARLGHQLVEMSPSSKYASAGSTALWPARRIVLAIWLRPLAVPITLNIGELPYFCPGAVELRDTGTGIVK
jgi:hypothetical protein